MTGHVITGWPDDEALMAVEFCFKKWLAQRGSVTQSEETRLIQQVQAFFEANGASRFTQIGSICNDHVIVTDNEFTRDRVGFKDVENSRFYVLPNQLDKIVIGFNKTSAIKTLVMAGYIITDKHGKPQTNKRIPGSKTPKKVYEFSNKVLAEEEKAEIITDAAIS